MKKLVEGLKNAVALVASFYGLVLVVLSALAALTWPIWVGALIWVHSDVAPPCTPTPTVFMPEYWDMDDIPTKYQHDVVLNPTSKEDSI